MRCPYYLKSYCILRKINNVICNGELFKIEGPDKYYCSIERDTGLIEINNDFTLEEILGSIAWNRRVLGEEKFKEALRFCNLEEAYITYVSIPGCKIQPDEYSKLLGFMLYTNELVVKSYELV